jgi:hypothetical protein
MIRILAVFLLFMAPGKSESVPSSAIRVRLDRSTQCHGFRTMVEWDDGADRTSNDADVSIAPSKIPYSGFSPVRLQGQHVR